MARWTLLGLITISGLATACGSGTDQGSGSASGSSASATGATGSTGSTGATGSGGAGTSGSTGAGAGEPCTMAPFAPGDSTIMIDHGGVSREYTLHVPPGYDGTMRVPLIMNFHGYTSNMAQQAIFSAMNPVSDMRGFVVAYPNGLANPGGTTQSWNAGSCCAFGDTMRDDVGFARAVVADISSKVCVHPKRIYSTGMSNGGFMSHYLACEAADLFAAIGPVAGVLGIPDAECHPSRPISVIHFHGTADSLVSYDGGGMGGNGAPATFNEWGARNGCTGTPVQTFTNGAAHCDTYESCNEGVQVTLCTIDGMGHCWPGQSFCPFGMASTDIIANDAMLEVFDKYTLP